MDHFQRYSLTCLKQPFKGQIKNVLLKADQDTIKMNIWDYKMLTTDSCFTEVTSNGDLTEIVQVMPSTFPGKSQA